MGKQIAPPSNAWRVQRRYNTEYPGRFLQECEKATNSSLETGLPIRTFQLRCIWAIWYNSQPSYSGHGKCAFQMLG